MPSPSLSPEMHLDSDAIDRLTVFRIFLFARVSLRYEIKMTDCLVMETPTHLSLQPRPAVGAVLSPPGDGVRPSQGWWEGLMDPRWTEELS